MKKPLCLLALSLSLPLPALAHTAFLLPSATVVAPKDYVTVDAGSSDEVFFFGTGVPKLESLRITAPDGSQVQPESSWVSKVRSSFDLPPLVAGTYRVALVNSGLAANYEDENGQPKRWRGVAEDFAKNVPADAKKLKVTASLGRIETFVTAGKPNELALKPTGQGLELQPVTHPNDLFSAEAATFRLLVDGQPTAGLQVELLPDGRRYRNQPVEYHYTTDKNGQFTVKWPSAGRFFMGVSYSDQKAQAPATERRLSYSVTLEVLPQ